MKEEGYGDYWLPYAQETRGHALGHGIGLDMVEWPRRYPRDWDIVLEPNMRASRVQVGRSQARDGDTNY